MTRRPLITAAALVAVLALAGCSGSDSDSSPPSSDGGAGSAAAGGGDVDQVPGQVVRADSAAISPDGSRLVAGCRDQLCVWDTSDGSLTATYDGGSVVAWSPDGSLIATDGFSDDGSHATIELIDAESGSVERTLTGHDAEESDDAVGGGITALAFSADGATLASAGHDGTVRLWQVSDGTETSTLTTTSKDPDAVALSPDGSRLVVASPDAPVEMWDLTFGGRVATLGEEPQGAVVWSPDGKQIATASRAADARATVDLWNADTLVQTGRYPGGVQAYQLAYSPDGASLAMSQKDDDTVLVWPVAGGRAVELPGHRDQPRAVVWSPDGKVLYSLSSGEGPIAWDPTTGKREQSFEVPSD